MEYCLSLTEYTWKDIQNNRAGKMNLRRLKKLLIAENMPPACYSLNGTIKPMAYIIFYSSPKWWTCECDERGRISDKKQFDTEDEACNDLLNRLRKMREYKFYNYR